MAGCTIETPMWRFCSKHRRCEVHVEGCVHLQALGCKFCNEGLTLLTLSARQDSCEFVSICSLLPACVRRGFEWFRKH
jgi:hypothetical protein